MENPDVSLRREMMEILATEKQFIGEIPPSEHRLIVMLGGQPGAGKSMSLGGHPEIKGQLGPVGSYYIVDADAVRDSFPTYKSLQLDNDKTASSIAHPYASEVVAGQLKTCREAGVNVFYDGTMGSPSGTSKAVDEFKNSSYRVDLHVLAVDEKRSWQGVVKRYEEGKVNPPHVGRMVPRSVHDDIYKKLPETLRAIEAQGRADSITIYSRDGVVLYQNRLVDGVWQNPTRANEVLQRERERPLTGKECEDYEATAGLISKLQSRPTRNVSMEEFYATQAMQQDARAMVAEAKAREAEQPAVAAEKGRVGDAEKEAEKEQPTPAAQPKTPEQAAPMLPNPDQLAKASSPKTPPHELHGLARLDIPALSDALARNRSTPAEALETIARSPKTGEQTLLAVIAHANTSPAILSELAGSKHESVRLAAETRMREQKAAEEQRTKAPEKAPAKASEKPKMIIVAGPVGSGKGTLVENDAALKAALANVQRIAENAAGKDAITAKQEAQTQAKAAIGEKKSFAIETRLEGRAIAELMRDARAAGYETEIHFVGISAPTIAGERADKAGQPLRTDNLSDRYAASMTNIKEASQLADHAHFYGNDGKAPEKLALLERGKGPQLLTGQQPEWLKTMLPSASPGLQAGKSIETGHQRSVGSKAGGGLGL
jgi:predicted ABC-type ATPase